MNHQAHPLIGELTMKLLIRSGEDVIQKVYHCCFDNGIKCMSSLTESEKNLKMIY